MSFPPQELIILQNISVSYVPLWITTKGSNLEVLTSGHEHQKKASGPTGFPCPFHIAPISQARRDLDLSVRCQNQTSCIQQVLENKTYPLLKHETSGMDTAVSLGSPKGKTRSHQAS